MTFGLFHSVWVSPKWVPRTCFPWCRLRCGTGTAFPFLFTCSQQVSEELSKTNVRRWVGLGLGEFSAWEMCLSCWGIFCFHRRSERGKNGSLVRRSMTKRGIWRWRSNGVWISNSEQIKKRVLENGSVFIEVPCNTRIVALC